MAHWWLCRWKIAVMASGDSLSNPGKILILTHSFDRQALHAPLPTHIMGHFSAPTSSTGMAEINNVTAATVIAEEKCIICESWFEGECSKMTGFYVVNIVFWHSSCVVGLAFKWMISTIFASRLPARSTVLAIWYEQSCFLTSCWLGTERNRHRVDAKLDAAVLCMSPFYICYPILPASNQLAE